MALRNAIEAGDLDQVRQLLAEGADVNARDGAGRSPLMGGCSDAQGDCVAVLLAAGAEVNARTADGETALMGAAAAGSLAIVKTLIAAGADPLALDKSGTTAMEYAAIKGHAAVVRYFRDNHPMDAEAIRRSKFVAEVFDHPAVVEVLN